MHPCGSDVETAQCVPRMPFLTKAHALKCTRKTLLPSAPDPDHENVVLHDPKDTVGQFCPKAIPNFALGSIRSTASLGVSDVASSVLLILSGGRKEQFFADMPPVGKVWAEPPERTLGAVVKHPRFFPGKRWVCVCVFPLQNGTNRVMISREAALPVMLLIHASTSTACTRLPSLVTLWEPAADCGDDEHDYMDLALRLRIGRGWETSRHLSPPELPTSASISGAPAEMSLPCSVNPFASPA